MCSTEQIQVILYQSRFIYWHINHKYADAEYVRKHFWKASSLFFFKECSGEYKKEMKVCPHPLNKTTFY